MSWDATRPSNTRAARTMRDRVLREEPICRQCDQPSTQDDHIIGWAQREAAGLTVSQWHARSNHQGLCKQHHQEKTTREALAGRQAKSGKRKRRVHPSEVGGTPHP